jgi:hypothetical protein
LVDDVGDVLAVALESSGGGEVADVQHAA